MPRWDDDYEWPIYVSAGDRRKRAEAEAARLTKKGRKLEPVCMVGNAAKTFWGKAWCKNLERYSDYSNRLPRGRSYLRSGAVIDLQIAKGKVTALVRGSRLYEAELHIATVQQARWKAICKDCSGAIESVIALLEGRLPEDVMSRLCQPETGLFPSPRQIKLQCSCPDYARLCKHLAAVLYGIGVRLDQRPDLLFVLRNVDQEDLIAHAGEGMVKEEPRRTGSGRILEVENLSDIFGIEIASLPKAKRTRKK